MKKTVRRAARDREPLSGVDAQALEGALQQAEREIAALRVLLRECREKMLVVLTALSEYIGDTDPDIPEDWDEDDIKAEEPLMWCCRRLSELAAALEPK